MGATSITGVGPGSVSGLSRGSEHMSLGVQKLIGPKVSSCGTVTLSGTTATVQFPALVGLPANYIILLTSTTATAPYISTALATVTNTNDWSFVCTAGSGATVTWACLSIGLGYINVPG